MTAYMDHKDLANETISDDRAREIADGAHRVLDLIARTEFTSGREEGSVTLLAATKTRDVGEIMAAIDAGVPMIGENRPQEVIAKIDGLRYACLQRGIVLGASDMQTVASLDETDDPEALDRLPLHLIGQLQSNKIGKMLPDVNTIESVDSFELAEKIARRAAAREQTVGVLLEVNESGEPTKSGCTPDEAFELALRIAQLEGLELQGLMTVGAHVDDEREIRRGFAHLRDVRDRVRDSDAEGTATCVELSMGMSGDMTYAIDEGATIVRIGQAIFGERDFK
ncbi:YggS family pyridoxal phosphate-dependent enzyme [Bifidobacterium pseudolongum]|uniref:YggS family pyridoxal phosphate-dependent enzyme n=1 Tax=Bifidobacterium pseudolongum TaxID=1694 RepID=UPI001CE0E1E9|nr:YggS family pyridoxal phosphate-dependent enzyme [Bifidobacterium pseudolongum]UBY94978.1 YggS family pyridoxal phosphate-dependent enzyme [Bifidobacterium pseudolongum]UBZ03813.1 YggS family pyridoxal phosphate-dependent enzyme [Bifidobacterium pseudolongum]UBZ05383.1 YggS family pyridoxal phosphate-dependent enzyme [Bifidobacterium pseudolongum]UDL24394.1 YggS family pyridoxal phosphate-dependent enzyme [Bifidobacterium pseudolongum]